MAEGDGLKRLKLKMPPIDIEAEPPRADIRIPSIVKDPSETGVSLAPEGEQNNPYLQRADEMTDNAAGRTLKSIWRGAGQAAGAVGGAIKENVLEPTRDYIKEGHQQIMAGRPDKTSWDEVLIGATPMLLAALTGDYETGAEFAGKGLLDYEKIKRNAASEQAKAAAKNKVKQEEYRFLPIETEDGIRVARAGKRSGKLEDTGFVQGYKKSISKDPRKNELIQVSGSTGVAKDLDDRVDDVIKSNFNVKQKEEVDKTMKSFRSDKEVIRSRSGLSASRRAYNILSLENPVGDQAMKTVYPRMFGEVGNLAVQEQERFSGSSAIGRKWEALKNKLDNGKLTIDDREDLLELAKVMYNYDKRQLLEQARKYSDSHKAIYNYGLEKAIDPFLQEDGISDSIAKETKEEFKKDRKPRYKDIPIEGRTDVKVRAELQPDGSYKKTKLIYQ